MLNELKEMANYTRTENGALTYASTMDACLDLFATIGGMRHADEDELINRFVRAYAENPDSAMKLLFYSRDVRGGLGERRIFKTLLKYLAINHSESVIKNINLVAEYGRYDDLLVLFDTPCEQAVIKYFKEELDKDVCAVMEGKDEVSLLGKWLPSINTSSKTRVAEARKLAKAFGMSEKEYRKTLSMLRKKIDVIENHLREKAYDFDYEKQCSKALFKYRAAFYRNDGERYSEFINKVSEGTAKMNTGTLMPYEIVEKVLDCSWSRRNFMKVLSEQEKKVLNATWNALPDYCSDENALAVIDTSGSMYDEWAKPSPASVALSLGLYFAEHSKGHYANHFIEFSSKPRLIEIKGETFADKLEHVCSFCEVANTNIEAVFALILKTAVKNNLPQEELPSKLYIISDMEFDGCVKNSGVTNFENAKRKFEAAGYKLPTVVFWNVASRAQQVPVKKNEQGVILVSGCTPRIFEQAMNDNLNPLSYMMEILGSERYEKIVA